MKYTISHTGAFSGSFHIPIDVNSIDTKLNSNVVHKPWGTYQILYDDEICKIKRIVVFSEQMPSYQSHLYRDEFWFVLSGNGLVIVNEKRTLLVPGTGIKISRFERHRPINTGTEDLVFIEIQTGDSFEEDDIVRYDDIYHRESFNEYDKNFVNKIRGK